jgi:hypothetical protein
MDHGGSEDTEKQADLGDREWIEQITYFARNDYFY